MKRLFTTWNPAPSKITNGFEGAVGRTPLIRIKTLSEKFKCEILGKAEFLNPGGSVKDRAAYFMIREAEKSGNLRPGGTVVEGTAGNTGIGIAHICRARGYKCVIFMPNTQSKEKIDLLKMLGAEVHAVPAVPYEDPKNYNHQAKHFAESLGNAVWTNQFDNIDNRNGHFKSTGPELWYQTEGKVDAFTCATGTGGTLAGVTAYLKSKKSDVKCFLADPPGSCLYKYITSGGKSLERTGSSITEGIGQGRVTYNLAGDIALLDGALYIPDEETIEMVYRLLDEEGLFIGASSALNVVAACKVAQLLGPGKVVTTVICDGAYRYQSRLFSKSWLESKKLFNALPEHLRKYASLQ